MVSFGQTGKQQVVIVGRVVDQNGNPTTNAEITYVPGPLADMVPVYFPDADGRFEFKDDRTIEKQRYGFQPG